MWPITCFIARAYGREAFIRSCALRILEAETISRARVTLRVFCPLLILVLISRPPAISYCLAQGVMGMKGMRGMRGMYGSMGVAADLAAAFPIPFVPCLRLTNTRS